MATLFSSTATLGLSENRPPLNPTAGKRFGTVLNMKAILSAILAVTAGYVLAGTHAVVAVVSGKVIGNGTTYETATSKGTVHKLVMTLQSPNGTASHLTQVSYTDSLGKPTKSLLEIKAGDITYAASVTFTGRTAKYTMSAQGKTKTVSKVAPAGLPINDQSNFWFKTIQPKIGKTLTLLTFDIQQGEWQKTTIVYKGDKTLKIGATNYRVHEVIQTVKAGDVNYSQTVYLDNEGDTVQFIGPSLTVQRKD